MKKKSFYLCSLFAAALMFTGCSDNEVTPGGENLGELRFSLNFDGTTAKGSRATVTTAIPVTSWANVKNLRILLYNSSGVIKFAKTVQAPGSGSANQTFNFTDILTGAYTLVAIANTQSSTDNVVTYGTGTNSTTANEWADEDMIGKPISDMLAKLKETTTWPNAVPTTHEFHSNATKKAFLPPSEIFTGYATATVAEGAYSGNPLVVSLKREVSMMRVRMNVQHLNVVNTINWETDKASIFIYRLPESFKIMQGNDGGISKDAFNNDHVQVATGYNAVTPNSGYDTDANFTYWKDLIVFPNYTGRSITASDPTAEAAATRKYFVVISGEAKTGHQYADNTDAVAGDPIFWYRVINENFTPNTIREVNLTVETGGYKELPEEPLTYGDLDIVVSSPEDWSSNIQQSDINV